MVRSRAAALPVVHNGSAIHWRMGRLDRACRSDQPWYDDPDHPIPARWFNAVGFRNVHHRQAGRDENRHEERHSLLGGGQLRDAVVHERAGRAVPSGLRCVRRGH